MTPPPDRPRRPTWPASVALCGIVILMQGCAPNDIVPMTRGVLELVTFVQDRATPHIPPKLAAIQSRPIPSTPEAVAEEIAIMVEIDQEMRFALTDESGKTSQIQLLLEIPLVRKLGAIDHANTERMKRIVDRFGWPTIGKFGQETAHYAWLLVQHADAQPDFQRHCLDLMKPLFEQGEVRKDSFAYLTDRVLLAEGEKQIYGTQFHTVDGVFQPRPLIDPGGVDTRRKEMGMVTMEEYKTWFKH